MKMLNGLKHVMHRFAYSISFLLPLSQFWSRLHENDYHPDVEGIKSRIIHSRTDPSYKLFDRWSRQLNYPLDLRNKRVLEIGHGGAWYLAEALDAGALQVYGYEIAEEINSRAESALSQLSYKNFKLLKGNGKNLNVLSGEYFDFIFSITVLQHIPTRVTKNYLSGISSLLTSDGICVLQTLQSYKGSRKRLSAADLFSVAYSKQEFDLLLRQSGLVTKGYVTEEYGSADTHWGIYLLSKSEDL